MATYLWKNFKKLLGMWLFFFFGASCSIEVPDNKSALVLTIDQDESCAESCKEIKYIEVILESTGFENEKWGFFARTHFPQTFELWTEIDGLVRVSVNGYTCPSNGCRDVSGNSDFIAGKGYSSVSLLHGKRVNLTISLFKSICGNGIVEVGEECDIGGAGENFCQEGCSYETTMVLDNAGGEKDSIASFPLMNGFAVSWTEEVGVGNGETADLKTIFFDENGSWGNSVSRSLDLSYCLATADLLLSGINLFSWGNNGCSGFIGYCPSIDGVTCNLCYTAFDKCSGMESYGVFLEAVSFVEGKSFDAEMGGSKFVVVAGIEPSGLGIHVFDLFGGRETARDRVVVSGEGKSFYGVRVVFAGEGFIIAGWGELNGMGKGRSLLFRWNMTEEGEIVPFDLSPIDAGEDDSHSGGSGLVVMESAGEVEKEIAFVKVLNHYLEIYKFNRSAPRGEFELKQLYFDFAEDFSIEDAFNFMPNKADSASGNIFILVSANGSSAEGCSFSLVEISDINGVGNLSEIEKIYLKGSSYCSGSIVNLSAERMGLVMRGLAQDETGVLKGEVFVDIVTIHK